MSNKNVAGEAEAELSKELLIAIEQYKFAERQS